MNPELFIGSVLPLFVAGCLIAFAAVHLALVPSVIRKMMNLKWYVTALMLLTVALGAYLRFYHAPDVHRIFYDEDRYLSNSVTLARFGKSTSAELATPGGVIIGKPDQAVRVTVPALHAIVLRTFGYSEHNLFMTSRVVSTLLIASMIALGLLLFKSPLVALIAGAGMAFLPLAVYWSASIALDPYFVYFAVVSMCGVVLHAARPDRLSLLFTTLGIFLLLCVRLEAFVLLPVFAYAYWTLRRSDNKPLLTRSTLLLIAVLLPLIIIRGAASLSVLGEKWCCADALPLEAFSIKYITRNFLPNLLYYVTGTEFPFFISLQIAALYFWKKTPQMMVLGLWIVVFFVFYSFYYAGLFFTPEYSGSYGRYFLILTPPLFLLYGEFVRQLGNWLMTRGTKGYVAFAAYAACTVTAFILVFPNYLQAATKTPFIYAYVDRGSVAVHNYEMDPFIAKTPKDALLIHPLTAPPLLHNRPVAFMTYFFIDSQTTDFVKKYLESGKKAYIVGPLPCKAIPESCKRAGELFEFTKAPFSNTSKEGFEVTEVTIKQK